MGISVKDGRFKLDAGDTTYMVSVVDDGYLAHVYYGKKISDDNADYLLRLGEHPLPPQENPRGKVNFMNMFSSEFPCYGTGDFRTSSLEVLDKNGLSCCDVRYESYEIIKGKPGIEDMPSTFGTQDECTTLILHCKDAHLDLQVDLIYTVFEQLDVITKRVELLNKSRDAIDIRRVLSASVDFDGQKYDAVTLNGAWARERHVSRTALKSGSYSVSSLRGTSSHQHNPFIALCDRDANDDFGNVYGFNLVYSGNFLAEAELSAYDMTRVAIGINPTDFSWRLKAGERFTAPEAVLVYSDAGFGKMSRTFHDLYRNHLIRGKYANQKRPILINNWEATYFNFDTDKLISIAKEASKSGIEMLVMDDGWFGQRSSDNAGLGDWIVNEEKIKGGLKYLVDSVNALGMKFGIWIEPEMVNPNSDLYRTHPDWCLHASTRDRSLGREQLVLDFSRKEVRDYIYESIKKVLSSANIEYVKWDMNRYLTEVGNEILPAAQQREIWHRYVLGLYDMMNRLTTDFPDILLENCSAGGGRFDPGMLYYSPQIWASDNTDAIDRLKIQQGTSLVYPVSAIGAHVSDVPNHTNGRITPFKTRGDIALCGTFGYELDVTRIPEEDRAQIKEQAAAYHKYNDLIRTGDFYRLVDVFTDKNFCAYMIVAKDKSEALVTCVQLESRIEAYTRRIRLKGLEPNAVYTLEETGETFSGALLMNGGINIGLYETYASNLYHFIKK